MIVAHNLMAMNTNRMYGINKKVKISSTEKLSSGYKINRSADDAAGLAISEKMRRQIRGLNQGQENIQDGISWVQIGDGAMAEVNDMLHRVEELAVKAANETLTDDDRAMIDREIQHIKKEINNIGKRTVFNEQQIFLEPGAAMYVDGVLEDLTFFNSEYDSATGEVAYGGFLYRGERITWDTVDADMVYQDADTGEMLFHEGVYNYELVDGANTYKFEIECEEGATVPKVTRIIDVEANATGINVDGVQHTWDDFVDESGVPASAGKLHAGIWTMAHKEDSGVTIAFSFGNEFESLNEMIDMINEHNDGVYTYTWEQPYVGTAEAKAVNMNIDTSTYRVSNEMRPHQSGGSLDYTLRADEDGVWLDDSSDTKIDDSFKTWEQLGIPSWDSGDEIAKMGTFQYEYEYPTNGTKISFDFSLLDVTSVDSVIDGLDGVSIDGLNINNSYELDIVDSSTGGGVSDLVSATGTVSVNFQEEWDMNRDFDQRTQTVVDNQAFEYDATNSNVILNLGNEIEFSTYSIVQQKQEKNLANGTMKSYSEYVEEQKIEALLAGRTVSGTDQSGLDTPDFVDVVGAVNCRTDFDAQTFALTDDTTTPPTVSEHPAASIDFKDLGTSYCLNDLLGTNIKLTNDAGNAYFYKIVFVDDTNRSGSTPRTTGEGYEYYLNDALLLEIDINSLKHTTDSANRVTDGEGLANAIVAIMQDADKSVNSPNSVAYTANGSELVLYDTSIDKTNPDMQNQESPFRLGLTTSNAAYRTTGTQTIELHREDRYGTGDEIELAYSYDFEELMQYVTATMAQDDIDGEYVAITKPDSTIAYEQYNADMHGNATRFSIQMQYEMDGNSYISLDDLRDAYVQKTYKNWVEDTTVDLNALDYTTFQFWGDENGNKAIVSKFDSEVVKEKMSGLYVQCSADSRDKIELPRFALNTFELKMYRANTKTAEDASETITMTKKAVEALMQKRTLFGVTQNRLEYAYNVNGNVAENTAAAESLIRDTDMAKEMVKYSNHDILDQAGLAMLVQANQSKQGVLTLLG